MFYVGMMVRVFSPHILWLDNIFIPTAERHVSTGETVGDEWSGHRVITIARMYGSGGNAIGEYDLVINTERTGINGAVEMILHAAKAIK